MHYRLATTTDAPALAEMRWDFRLEEAPGHTATAKAEVEYLLSRVARVDRRANLQPQSSAAG